MLLDTSIRNRIVADCPLHAELQCTMLRACHPEIAEVTVRGMSLLSLYSVHQLSMQYSAFILNPSLFRGQIRKVVMLRNGPVRTKQNLSNAHVLVVCWFPKHYEFRRHYLAGIFVAFCRFRSCCENRTNPLKGQLLISKNQSEIVCVVSG